MANPAGLTELPETEYVEIYNASSSDLSLNGWTFVYDGSSSSLPDFTIKAGQYAVLFRAGRDIHVDDGGIAVAAEKFPSALANTSKTVAIKNSKGTVIDEVTYPQATAAKSYERLTGSSWHLSTDTRGGTPGSVNSKENDPNLPPPDITDSSQPGDVIINEVMANPAGLTELPETEYVEIYNASSSDLSLNGWTFVYDGSSSSLPDFMIKAGQYAVLFRAGRDIHVDDGGIAVAAEKFPSALANTSKTVAIKNSKGTVIDEITYPQATAAKSYERLTGFSWHLSTDTRGGTPGSVNSKENDPNPPSPPPVDAALPVEPLDIIINEILANPYTGGSEYIELYNRSYRDLTIDGLAIAFRNTEGNLRTHYLLKSITDTIRPNGYLVITKSREGVLNFYPQSPPESVHEVNLPTLNNEGSDIVLFRAKDIVVIDEVNYSSDWHDGSIKNQKGVSLERISPDAGSNDGFNWSSAVAEVGYGTPGYKNSQNRPESTSDKIFVNSPEYVFGFDYYEIKYKTDKQGYECRMDIYTTSGMKVAEIANNQLLTLEGVLRWEGKDRDGRRLSPGIYVFYVEMYNHQTGNRKVFKKAFLVR
jgi:hypothetical protein